MSAKGKYHDDLRGDCEVIPFGKPRHMAYIQMNTRHCILDIRSLTTTYLVSRYLQWPKPLHP